MFLRRVGLLAGKEFRQFLRDRAMLPIALVMPILQLIMFGYVVGADVRDLPTAVLDQDLTGTSRQVVRAFEGSGYFRTIAKATSEREVREMMDRNRIGVALVIPHGFARRVRQGRSAPVQVIVDGSDSKVSQIAASYSQQILAELSPHLYAGPDGPMGGAGRAAGMVDAQVRVMFNPALTAVNAMIPGLMALILLLSSGILMSQAVVKERERGNLEQLFVTPIRRSEYLLGKTLPYVAIATVQIAVVFVVGTLWYRVPFEGSFLVLFSGLFLFLLTGLGIGLFVSTISQTRHQAQQAMMFMLIPSMVLSGFIFPIESMPEAVRPVTYLVPLRYILVIVRAVFLKGSGFADLWQQFAALTVYALVVFGAALARFRKRLAE